MPPGRSPKRKTSHRENSRRKLIRRKLEAGAGAALEVNVNPGAAIGNL